jgi:hypothetical protein
MSIALLVIGYQLSVISYQLLVWREVAPDDEGDFEGVGPMVWAFAFPNELFGAVGTRDFDQVFFGPLLDEFLVLEVADFFEEVERAADGTFCWL